MLDPKKWAKLPGRASQLQKNAAKALRMKADAGSPTTTPEHRTSHDGGVQKGQVDATDMGPGIQGTHVENVSRSRGARISDSSGGKS